MAEPGRIAQPGDSEEIAGLLHRFNAEFDEFTPGAAVLDPRVRDNIERKQRVFVLASPPDVGLAQLHFREYLHTGTPICNLEELYVVPDRRGEGHGRRLMETAFTVARQRGATNMELGTSLDDTAARGLYESLGFTNLEKPDRPETQMLFYEREL